MLLLTRNVNQRIFINGTEIIITVTAANYNQVKLGIEALKNISVIRAELLDELKAI